MHDSISVLRVFAFRVSVRIYFYSKQDYGREDYEEAEEVTNESS